MTMTRTIPGRGLLILLLIIANVASLCTAVSLSKAQALRNWLVREGAMINDKVTVTAGEYGYSLFAEEAVPPYEIMCSIPPNICFTSTEADPLTDLSKKLTKEMHLRENSYYWPFLDTLPEDVSYIPALWNPERLELIKGTSIYDDATRMKAEWEQSYEANGIQEPKDTWMWSRATLQGRCFSFRFTKSYSELKGTAAAFVPFISLGNHHDEAHAFPEVGDGQKQPEDNVFLRSDLWQYKGQEIFLTYGTLSFQQKLIGYGWVDTKCEHCITPIDVPNSNGRQVEIKSKRKVEDKGTTWMKRSNNMFMSSAVSAFSEAGGMSKDDAIDSIRRQVEQRYNGLAKRAPSGDETCDIIVNTEKDTLAAVIAQMADQYALV